MHAQLRAVEDEPVLQVDRLRYHGGRPVLHTTAHVPAWVGTRLARETLSARTMLEPLAQGGIELVAATQETHAAPCPEAVALLIGLEPGDPVFVIERLVSAREDRPVQHLLATFRWDSFSYRINSTGEPGHRRVEIEGSGRIAAVSNIRS